MVHLTLCSYHVMYVYQSESTLNSSLNVKELLAWSWREIWSFSDCKWTRIHDHLVYKGTLNRLDKLAKWLSCVVITYLCSAFGCMFLSCNVRVSEWIQARPVWKNGRVFIYELSACGFESSCSHLDFRIPACFEEGVPWHSGNYRVLIHKQSITIVAPGLKTYSSYIKFLILQLLMVFNASK